MWWFLLDWSIERLMQNKWILRYLEVPLGLISNLSTVDISPHENVLLIMTKDLRTLAIKLNSEEEQRQFEDEVRQLAFPPLEFNDDLAFINFKYEPHNYFKEKKESPSKLWPKSLGFTWEYEPRVPPTLVNKILEGTPIDKNGWDVYNTVEEFERQGVTEKQEKFKILHSWSEKETEGNTYPETVYVPFKISHTDVTKWANFRTRKRFPALSFYFEEKGTSLWRCSQIRTGIFGARSSEDEAMIQHIGDTNEHTDKVIIVDARSFISASGNKLTGGGFESEENYTNSKVSLKFHQFSILFWNIYRFNLIYRCILVELIISMELEMLMKDDFQFGKTSGTLARMMKSLTSSTA